MDIKKRLENMLKEIEDEVVFTERFIGKKKLDDRVMQAMHDVPRHEFVSKFLKSMAYMNGPLSIGHGQTISQPYIVALMTDMLKVDDNSVVLEIGTGSGYQAAVLSKIVKQVYTMEVIPELLESAQQKFEQLGYNNIESRLGDGHDGWPEHALYDGIIVTAAATGVPEALIEQLKPGANLVIPVNRDFGPQELLLVKKQDNGEVVTEDILAVAFVPLVRTHVYH